MYCLININIRQLKALELLFFLQRKLLFFEMSRNEWLKLYLLKSLTAKNCQFQFQYTSLQHPNQFIKSQPPSHKNGIVKINVPNGLLYFVREFMWRIGTENAIQWINFSTSWLHLYYMMWFAKNTAWIPANESEIQWKYPSRTRIFNDLFLCPMCVFLIPVFTRLIHFPFFLFLFPSVSTSSHFLFFLFKIYDIDLMAFKCICLIMMFIMFIRFGAKWYRDINITTAHRKSLFFKYQC